MNAHVAATPACRTVIPQPFVSVFVFGMSRPLRMGGGIAMCFIQKGIPVVLKDAKQVGMRDSEGP